MKVLRIVFVTLIVLMITNLTYAVNFGENSWNLDNSYANMQVVPIGTSLIYTGYGTKSLIYGSTNILGVDIVDGVSCVRVKSMRTEKSNFSKVWLAQDMSGNVFVLKN
jgi:hypothetical protein